MTHLNPSPQSKPPGDALEIQNYPDLHYITGTEAVYNFKMLYKDHSFQSTMFCFVLVSVPLKKISTLIAMKVHNAEVVGGTNVALRSSNRCRKKLL